MTLGSGLMIGSFVLAAYGIVIKVIGNKKPENSTQIGETLVKILISTEETRVLIMKEFYPFILDFKNKMKSIHDSTKEIDKKVAMIEDNTKETERKVDEMSKAVLEIRLTQKSIDKRIK